VDSVKIGEVVVLHARVHTGPQGALASPVPALIGELPEGVRLLGADTLRASGVRSVLSGDVRFAFYRPGQFQIPELRLVLRPIASDRGQPLGPDPIAIIVGSSLPPGNPSLKDIRDQLPRTPIDPLVVVAAAAAAVVLVWLARRLLHRQRAVEPSNRPSTQPAPSALAVARAELDRIAAEPWLETGNVAKHYEAVADVLRRYFVTVVRETNRAQTSSELLRALGSYRSNGAWHGTREVLGDADLVKFAGVTPDAVTARAWTGDVRRVLDAWAYLGEHN
jgi:hypothetical protein